MERAFADQDPSVPNIFNYPATSPYGVRIATQQPSLEAQAAAIAVPPSLLFRAALPRSHRVSFPFDFGPPPSFQSAAASPFSPDPPASGPGSNMAPASLRLSQIRMARPTTVASAGVSSLGRTQQCQNSRRAAPAPTTADLSAAAEESIRRSTRTRKRPPSVASIPAATRDDSRDPPAKKPRRANLKSPPPGPKTDQSEDAKPESESSSEETASCCICMGDPVMEDVASINGCDHVFCFECIEKWAERENSCPLCKVRFTKIDRVHKAKKKGGERAKNTKRVKQKDQRSDLAPGAALEGLLASFASSANFPPHRVARLIFSGIGGNPFMLPGSTALRANRAAGVAARASALEDSLFSSDTDDDDEGAASFLPGGGPASFADLFRSMPLGGRGPIVVGGGIHGVRPLSFSFDPPTAARSYASNGGDRNAGRQAENPLEIDDDSEEEIEVVQVTRPV